MLKNSSNLIQVTIIDNDTDEEVEHDLPARFEVCPRCEGHGTHLHPDIGQHAYTGEEFFEEFDEEGREEYFKRGGIYDVTCERCGGQRVVQVIDEDRLTSEQKEVFKAYQEREAERARWDAVDRDERRYGC